MAVSNATFIEVSAGFSRPAEDLVAGGPVLATGLGGQWASAQLKFVDSMRYDASSTVLVQFGATQLVVTFDQSFVLATKDREIVIARKLKPGDALLGADGSAIPIDDVVQGEFGGTFITFATDSWQYEPTWNGHLVNAAGVVIGDKTVMT